MTPRILYFVNVDWYFILHWLERARAAQKSGYEVHIATAITNDINLHKIQSEGFLVHPLPLSRRGVNPLREFLVVYHFFKILRAISPSIVHSATIKPNIYSGLCRYLYSVPLVATVPGLGGAFIGQSLLAKAKKILFSWVYRLTLGQQHTLVLCENDLDVSLVKSITRLPQEQVQLIPGAGVDRTVYTPSAEPDTASGVIVLFAARLYRNKGLHILVEAVEQLQSSGVNVKLWVAGLFDPDTPGSISEQQLLEWNAAGLIKWLGPTDDMPELLSRVHLVCLPSLTREGLPRILLESMSCGKPIITTDVPGCGNLIDQHQCGLKVVPESADRLAAAIRSLVTNTELRSEMGENGRRAVEQYYSSDHVIKATLAAYRQLDKTFSHQV